MPVSRRPVPHTGEDRRGAGSAVPGTIARPGVKDRGPLPDAPVRPASPPPERPSRSSSVVAAVGMTGWTRIATIRRHFQGHVEHRVHAFDVGLAQHPRGLLGEVGVGVAQDAPDGFERTAEFLLLERGPGGVQQPVGLRRAGAVSSAEKAPGPGRGPRSSWPPWTANAGPGCRSCWRGRSSFGPRWPRGCSCRRRRRGPRAGRSSAPGPGRTGRRSPPAPRRCPATWTS